MLQPYGLRSSHLPRPLGCPALEAHLPQQGYLAHTSQNHALDAFQHHAFNAPSPAFQGASFSQGPSFPGAQGPSFPGGGLLGGNLGGNYVGSYMHKNFGGFKPWGGFT